MSTYQGDDVCGCGSRAVAMCDAHVRTINVSRVVRIHSICARPLCAICRRPQVARDTDLCREHDAARAASIELRGFA